MKELYDVAIIGGGPGGYAAALYCARAGFSVLVLDKLGPDGKPTSAGMMDYFPDFPEGIDGYDLGLRMQKSAHELGAETVLAEVSTVTLTGQPKVLETSLGQITASTVILASGAYPRTLGLENEASFLGKGLSYYAVYDGMAYRDKTAVVVGGGNSAVSEALYLSRLCNKVYLVHGGDTLSAAKVYLSPLENSGVEVLWNSRVTGFQSVDGAISGVEVESLKSCQSRSIPCDGLFVSIGRVPDTALYRGQVDLDEEGYVVADESTCTNIPGVFAVGDLRQKPIRQVLTAAADGVTASVCVEKHIFSLLRSEIEKHLET